MDYALLFFRIINSVLILVVTISLKCSPPPPSRQVNKISMEEDLNVLLLFWKHFLFDLDFNQIDHAFRIKQ